jgi:hypothetical protein
MKFTKTIAMISFILLFNSCENKNDEIICTLNYVYGLNIKLIQKSTTNPINGVVKIIAKDGSYEETLENANPNDSFFGAGERRGTYILTVTSDNYKTYTSEPILVTGDECHVTTVSKTFELELK